MNSQVDAFTEHMPPADVYLTTLILPNYTEEVEEEERDNK